MSERDSADFRNINGTIGFFNGQFGAYVEDTLQPIITDEMTYVCLDIFELGDEECIPVDQALSDQVKKYPPLIYGGSGKPVETCNDFHFDINYRWDTKTNDKGVYVWDELENAEVRMKLALTELLEEHSDKEELQSAVNTFYRACHNEIGRLTGMEKVTEDVRQQLQKCAFFKLIVLGGCFFFFGDIAMLLTLIVHD